MRRTVQLLVALSIISGCSEHPPRPYNAIGDFTKATLEKPSRVQAVTYRVMNYNSGSAGIIPQTIDMKDLILATQSGVAVGKLVMLRLSECEYPEKSEGDQTLVTCTSVNGKFGDVFIESNSATASRLLHIEKQDPALVVGGNAGSRAHGILMLVR